MRSALLVLAVLSTSAMADDPPETTSYVVVIDRSASMRGDKLELVASAVVQRVEKLTPNDRVAIVSFGKTATVVSPLGAANPKRLERELASIKTDAGNNLVAGLDKAVVVLSESTGPKHVVVITDNANLAIKDVRPAIQRLNASGITVGMVGVGIEPRTLAGLGALSTGAVDELELLPRVVTKAFEGARARSMHHALALVIDRSASMQGAKLEMAKESARVCTEILDPRDTIAVITFDTAALVTVAAQQARNRMRISNEISRITSGGDTDILAGLKAAYAELKPIANHHKHVIVLTDGDSRTDGVAELVKEMHANGFTVSAVGVQGADRNLLSAIAEAGAGRLYMVEDIGSLPRIFMRETSSP